MRRTTAMEISQFAQARIQLSDVVCIYIYHGCRAIKSASGRAENYPGRMWEDKCRHRSNHLPAPGKFWHANNYVGLHRYTIHGTARMSRVCCCACIRTNTSGQHQRNGQHGAASSSNDKSRVHTLRFSATRRRRENILENKIG